MRIILHNGVELYFPDDTPEKVVENTVSNFLAKQEEKPIENNGLGSMILTLFNSLGARIEAVKASVLGLPAPLEPEKIDLTKLEETTKVMVSRMDEAKTEMRELNSALRNIATAIGDQGFERHAAEIKDILKGNNPDFAPMTRQLHADIVELKQSLTKSSDKQTDAIKKSIASGAMVIERNINKGAKSIVDAITSPKELVIDKKTGKPIGVKVKE